MELNCIWIILAKSLQDLSLPFLILSCIIFGYYRLPGLEQECLISLLQRHQEDCLAQMCTGAKRVPKPKHFYRLLLVASRSKCANCSWTPQTKLPPAKVRMHSGPSASNIFQLPCASALLANVFAACSWPLQVLIALASNPSLRGKLTYLGPQEWWRWI